MRVEEGREVGAGCCDEFNLSLSRPLSVSPSSSRLTEEYDRIGRYGGAQVPLLLGARHRVGVKRKKKTTLKSRTKE